MSIRFRFALLLLGTATAPANAQLESIFINSFEIDRHCGSASTFPCDRVPPEFQDLADPQVWNIDGETGVLFRRTTARERRINNWKPGTFLLGRSGLRDTAAGARRAHVLVPLGDEKLAEIDLVRIAVNADVQFYEREVTGAPDDRIVNAREVLATIYEYVQRDFDPENPAPIDGVWARATAGTDGGVLFHRHGGWLRVRRRRAPTPGWDLDDIQAPPGANEPQPVDVSLVELLTLGDVGVAYFDACDNDFAAAGCGWLCDASSGIPCDDNPHLDPPAPAHCSDGVNNDNDAGTDTGDEECQGQPEWGDDDHPSFVRRSWESGKSFALFAEGRLCTHYAATWKQRMTRLGWDTEVLVNHAIPFNGLTGGEMRLRYRAAGCWIFPSLEEANDCADDDTGCPGAYPYGGAGSSASSYYSNVWDDVDHGTGFGLNDALHMAQTVYWGGSNADTNKPLDCSASEGSGCCGAALSGGGVNTIGASVIQYEISTGGCNVAHAPVTSAHEFGHNAGLNHDEANGFMEDIRQEQLELVQCQSQPARRLPGDLGLPAAVWISILRLKSEKRTTRTSVLVKPSSGDTMPTSLTGAGNGFESLNSTRSTQRRPGSWRGRRGARDLRRNETGQRRTEPRRSGVRPARASQGHGQRRYRTHHDVFALSPIRSNAPTNPRARCCR